jgi:hypothetical protein
MDEIEWSKSARGGNRRRINEEEITEVLADALDSGLYNKLRIQSSPRRVNKSYTDNETFWSDALQRQHFVSMRVRLEGFHLTEWIPSAPGRYFRPQAKRSRTEAEGLYLIERNEYLLDGKRFMMLGGVGSFRLGPRELNGKGYYFLGASSTGISHEGIPIALDELKYHQVIQKIKMYGGYKVTLVGTLQLLPLDMSPIQYDRDIPKYYLVLDDIEDAYPSPRLAVFATVAIAFQLSQDIRRQGWSFCAFPIDPLDSGLHRAVDWLKDYARRYSHIENPPILVDFDEHYQHFDNPIEFSLSDISKSRFNVSRLERYSDWFGFTIVNIQEAHHVGDTYNVPGQAGAVGPNVHAHDMTFNQITTPSGQTIDLAQLAEQLSILRSKMKEQAAASGQDQDEVVGAIASAEKAAKQGKRSEVLESLAKAGKWALEVATSIGAGLAVEAIKAAMGMH